MYVDVNLIDAESNRQILGLNGLSVGGVRVVGLTQEGKGSSGNAKKGGDRREPTLEVTLHDRPIRISYRDRVWHSSSSLATPGRGWYQWEKRTYYNPKWQNGHGGR